MQKLFSQELRFKDENGKEFPKWEKKKIGKIADVYAGATPSTLKSEYWGGDIRWMNSGELNLKRVSEVENRITEKGLKNSSTKLLPKYCILIGLAGQGKTRGTVAMNLVELCTNQSIAAILPNPQKYDSEFLYHNLDRRYFELRKLSKGDGGRGGLNLQIIKSVDIELPSLKEQKRISEFITSIDKKIQNTDVQIQNIQIYKNGLLQNMCI
jgi:type I restriction enzyme S subunit